MKKRILVVNGHPSDESFCAAIAENYAKGAQEMGNEVRIISLGQIKFDPVLRTGFHGEQPLEADLMNAQHSIKWADHLVFVFPTWWGSMPAFLKGFIDRVFLPGFAFDYQEKSPFPITHLTGKTARIFVTMDSPYLYYRLMYFSPGVRELRVATLKFCGVKPVKVTAFDQVRKSTPEKREKWLTAARELGKAAQ